MLAAFDILWAMIAPVIALMSRSPESLEIFHAGFEKWLPILEYFVLSVACSLFAIMMFRLSESLTEYFSEYDLWSIAAASGVSSSLSAVLAFVADRLAEVPRSTPLILALVLFAGFSSARLAAISFGSQRAPADPRHAPSPARRILIAGVDRFSSQAVRLLNAQTPRALEAVAVLDDREKLQGRSVNGVRLAGRLCDIGGVVREYAVHGVEVDEVWVSDSVRARPEAANEIERQCEMLGLACLPIAVALNLAPKSAGPAAPAAPLHRPVRLVSQTGYGLIKRGLDVALSLALLTLLAPVWIAVAILVIGDVGAPAIFWQERIGRSGRSFCLYKFRTYRAPYDARGRAIAEAQRLSRVGRLLRASRLDELPQLFNILRGDMSLVGPRPLLPVDQPADPRVRLSVRPGVTGWAQVNGGVLLSAEEKDALDAWYVEHASLKLDLYVLWRTAMYFFDGERRDPRLLEKALMLRQARVAEDACSPGESALASPPAAYPA